MTPRQLCLDAVHQYFDGDITAVELLQFVASRLYYIEKLEKGDKTDPDPYLG